MKVLEVQIPFSYYAFNGVNNTFTLLENAVGPATVTIPVGNYTTTSLCIAMGAALTAASINHTTYLVTYSTLTAKFSITSNSLLAYSFSFGPSNISPMILIGFNQGQSTVSHSNGSAMIIDAPNSTLITGPNYLYLNSNAMGQMFSLFLPEGAKFLSHGVRGPQLAKIPVNVQPNGIIFWSDPSPEKWFDMENLANLSLIDFYLTLGNNDTVVQLNGLGFSLKIGVILNETESVNVGSSMRHNDRVVKTIHSR